MRSSVTETVLALSLAFRTGNITTRATHAATELGALLLQFPPWPTISQATAEQELAPLRLSASRPRKLRTGPADVRTKVAQLGS